MSDDQGQGSQRFDRVIAEYLQAVEAGTAPRREQLLAENPELADQLNEFFALHDVMRRAATDSPDLPFDDKTVEQASQGLSGATWATGDRDTLELGARVRYFGDYELLEEIARGGMGVVYKAKQQSLHRTVAVKMILAGQLASEEDVKRFHAEAEAAANLDHPGIVPIFEVGQYQDQHYFSMGYVEGSSLSARVAHGPLAPREAAEYMKKVADAIAYAHEHGVIHRDLKPANVLIDQNGEPRVTDFGLAKQVQGDSDLTASGQILGTPGFMPPEQASARIHDIHEASDIYSLGAVLYNLVTGRPPFQADNQLDTLVQVIEREPIAPRQLNPNVPHDLETICLKCLEKRQQRRYASAQEVADELQRFLNGEPIVARPIGRGARAWRWCKRKPALAALWTALAMLLLTFSVGGPIVAYQQAEHARIQSQLRSQAEKARVDAEQRRQEADQARAETELERQEAVRARADADRRRQEAEQARTETEQKRQEAEAARAETEQKRQEAERLARLNEEQSKEIAKQRDHALDNLYLAHMRSAQADWKANSISRMRAALEAHLPGPGEIDRRGWEWYYLMSLCHKDLATWQAHAGGAHAVAWSPGGDRLASGGADHVVRIWDLASGRELLALKGHTATISSVAWAPDGRRLASADKIGGLRIWDPNGGRELYARRVPYCFRDVAWSPDGRQVAAGCEDGTVRIWDAITGEECPTLRARDRFGAVNALAFSPDGDYLAGGSQSIAGWLQIWDWANGQIVAEVDAHSHAVNSLAWSPDGQRLASGSGDQTVKVWNTANWELVADFSPHNGHVSTVAWNSNGSQLATGGANGEVRIWDRKARQNFFAFRGHKALVRCVAWGPNDTWLASASYDGTVKLWNAADRQEVVTVEGVLGMACSPDGRKIATYHYDDDPKIAISNAITGNEVFRFSAGIESLRDLEWSPDGKSLVGVGNQGKLNVWDPMTGHVILSMQVTFPAGAPGINEVRSVAWSPNGKQLATAGADRVVRIWDAVTGRALLAQRGHSRATSCVAWSPDSSRLASVDFRRNVKLWDIQTGQEILELAPSGGERMGAIARQDGIVWSPDGRRLASGSEDRSIRIWDLTLGEQLIELTGHTTGAAGVWAVSWSPDGRRLFSSGGAWPPVIEGGPFNGVAIWDASIGYWLADQMAGENKSEISDVPIENAQRERDDGTRVSAPIREKLAKNPFAASQAVKRIAIIDLTKLIKDKPNDCQLLAERGRNYVSLQQWKEAVADYRQVVEQCPQDALNWLRAATLLAKVEDIERYQDLCNRMLAKFGESQEVGDADLCCKACLLLPETIPLSRIPLKPIEETLDKPTDSDSYFNAWGYITRAWAAHRTGQPEQVVNWLGKASESPGYAMTEDARLEAFALPLLAMAEHQLGNLDEARSALDRANSLIKANLARMTHTDTSNWHDWLIAEILLGEATTRIPTQQTTASPAEEYTASPADELEPIQGVSFPLEYSTNLVRWGINYYSPSHFDLAEQPPEGGWQLPPARGRQRLYGAWTIGEQTRIKVVLDVLDDQHTVMRFAFNDDVNFENKTDYEGGGPLFEFDVRYADGQTKPYAMRFYYPVSFAETIKAYRLQFYRASIRIGTIDINGTKLSVVLSDRNADGLYSDRSQTGVLIDLDGNGRIGRAERFSGVSSFSVGGRYYGIPEISPSGDRITVAEARSGQIIGTVVDAETLQPLENCALRLLRLGIEAKSDAAGNFRLVVPVGPHAYVTAAADGYVPCHKRLRQEVTVQRPVETVIPLRRATEQLQGELCLKHLEAYHFLAAKRYFSKPAGQFILFPDGGDFFVEMRDEKVTFRATQGFQRGLKDLGDLGQQPLEEVAVPESNFSRGPITAIVGHTYVVLARAGEEGHYIVMRVKEIVPEESVTVEYVYR
jgi:WD40 repeat protein/tRNA A-37 threonylcarbamoyl transferase component Bud32/tetratricopeptide (TPR) repeat protein